MTSHERTVNVPISDELHAAIRARAGRERVSVAAVVRDWLTEWAKDDTAASA